MKLAEKIEAISLRKAGKSYSEIREKIKVSKSTLTLWLREVELTSEQKERLYVGLRQANGYRLAKLNQQKRIRQTKKILEEAENEFPLLVSNSLFLCGLMLYWAEGDKSEIREDVKFSNSDPAMVTFMMRWFREICKVRENKLKIELHIHTLFCRPDIEKYWSEITKIPLSQFHKTQVKPTSLKYRKNHLYNGTCAIRINSKDLFRRIKGWKMAYIKTMGLSIPHRLTG
jgi:hypothetical protein